MLLLNHIIVAFWSILVHFGPIRSIWSNSVYFGLFILVQSIQFTWVLWEPKMCRLAWQLLGMLDNVLGMLCNVFGVLGMHFCKVLGIPYRRKTLPTCYLISCEAKGVVYHQAFNVLGMLATSSACIFARF